MEKFVYERTAYYYETDRMDVIHHSNYIRWFEEARVEFMRSVGYPYEKMEKEGIMLPVLSVECQYKTPVRFGDYVLICAAISSYNGLKMTVQYKITDKKTGELRVIGSTTHCFTDSDMKPVRVNRSHPEIHKIYSQALSEGLF